MRIASASYQPAPPAALVIEELHRHDDAVELVRCLDAADKAARREAVS